MVIYGVITYLRTYKAALMRRKRRNMHVCRWYIYINIFWYILWYILYNMPIVSKVFEKALYGQLYDYFVVNNLLSQNQFGFRQFHSTASALLDSTNEWFINMDRGQFNIAVFLDLQKAFDTINHNILIKKLDLYGLQKPALNLLGSYLENRFQMCTVNGVLFKKNLVTCGIPQGSILGPLLFLIYINDLPSSLEHSSSRMFADDTTLTVSGKSLHDVEVAINHDLSNVNQWLCANKLSLNLVKTEYILIGSRHNINNILATPKVFVGDIKRVRETKALGVYIHEFLSWEKHIDKIAKKVSSGIGAIRKLKSCVDRNHRNNRHRMRAPIFSQSKICLHKMAHSKGHFHSVQTPVARNFVRLRGVRM